MAAYGFAVFTGAFLLFQVQPLMGKYLLPWFGGAPAVWTTCMLFFQVLLLGGYAYAHLSSRLLKPRGQVLLHLALLAAAIAALPITPSDAWKPTSAADPTLRIIVLLAVSLGLPYFALSATAPLLQHWFSRTHPNVSPFRLYALSNAGSLLALLSYPTCFETWLTRTAQASLWSAGLGLYALACGWCGSRIWKAQGRTESSKASELASAPGPSAGDRLLWVLLPACASVLLLAITNKICQDVAVIAFLWVLPLALYLLSFIICFDRPQWYRRSWFGAALFLALAFIWGTLTERLQLSAPAQILVYSLGLFVCCMICHGEVYRLKPHPAHLTSFYLLISAGGALGGVLVAVIAPAVFTDYFELHLGLLLCGAIFLLIWARDRQPGPVRLWPAAAWSVSLLLLAGLALSLWAEAHRFGNLRVHRSRNFYGVLSVFRYQQQDSTLSQVELMHGRITHGMQYLHPSRAGWPTLYFSPGSGIGRTFASLPPGRRRVGVVGLGAGTLAAYSRPGDQFRFYEINPAVEQVARTYFTYLTNSPAKVNVTLGDARLSMEAEEPQNFDLLVLDAFNSDSIPIHLLTREAFQVYQRHLKPNAVVAVHVSNASLNLEPVVLNLAQQFGYEAAVLEQRTTDSQAGVLPSTWVVLARDPGFLQAAALRETARPATTAPFEVGLWTDDFSGLFRVLRWEHFFGSGPAGTKGREYIVAAAATLGTQSDMASAIAGFRAAVNQDSNSAPALNNLACLLATASDAALRDGAEAVRLAERACTLTGYRNTVMVSTLAAAYAEAGRFDEAVKTGEKACTLAVENAEQQLLERNRQLLEFYRRRQPYHQAEQKH